MGYCISMTDCNFVIKEENQESALQALKTLTKNKKFKWVGNIQLCDTLRDALNEMGYDVEFDNLNNISDLEFFRENLGDDEELFNAIAPYVEENSYIEMYGEDGCKWRWVFKNNNCEEIQPEINWD